MFLHHDCIIAHGTSVQPLVATFFQLFFLLLVLKIAPYKSDDDDISSFVTSLALLVTMVIGFSLLTDDKKKPSFSVGSMTALLLVINLLCIVYELIMMLIP